MAAALALAAFWIAPVIMLSVVVYLATAPSFLLLERSWRWVRGPRTYVESPAGRPIEQIAEDARRLGGQLQHPQDGRSCVRVGAIRLSYDRVLGEACQAVGASHLLGVLVESDGVELDTERRRVEILLTAAGVLEDVYG
jgi:hypothetical protein